MGTREYPQSMFWAEIWKISEFFLSENTWIGVFSECIIVYKIWTKGKDYVPNQLLDDDWEDHVFLTKKEKM